MLKFLVTQYKGIKAKFIIIIIISILVGLLSIVPIYFLEKTINISLESNLKLKNILLSGLLYVAFIFIHAIFNLLAKNFIENLDNKINYVMRNNIHNSILSADLAILESNGKNELMRNIIDDIKTTNGNITIPIYKIAYSISSFILCMYIMINIDWILILIVLPMTILVFLLIRLLNKKSIVNYSQNQKDISQMWNEFSNGIIGVREIILFKKQLIFKNRYENSNNNCLKSEIEIIKLTNTLSAIASLGFMLTIALILIIGSLNLSKGLITVGGLIAILMYNHMLTDPIFTFIDNQKNISKNKTSFKRISNLLNLLNDFKSKQIIKEFDNIVFNNISLAYGENIVLNNFNFEIKKGQKVLLVGSTGCGKSSLVKLLTTQYLPTSGNILINNTKITERVDMKISCLFQDSIIFNGTIEDNIILWDSELNNKRLKEIIKISGCSEIIEKYHKNQVGENGTFLSGGEKKRILIARCLYYDADIYIFDEMSSGLDLPLFYEIFNNMMKFLKNKTIIIVEHATMEQFSFDIKLEMKGGEKNEKIYKTRN